MTNEVREVLSRNRGPARQACSYWVPSIRGLDGNCFHCVAYQGLPATREGVVIRFGAPVDTLAHELGHLMTRAGHDDFDPSTNEDGQPLLRNNLMWVYSRERQEPRRLTDQQVARMHASPYTVLRR